MNRLIKLLVLVATLASALAAAAEEVHEDQCGHRPHLTRAARTVMTKAREIHEKQPEEAMKLLNKYVRSHPKERHFKLSFLQGVFAYQAQKIQESERLFSEAVDLWPCYVPALTNLAAVKYETNKPLDAAELMLKAYKNEKEPTLRYLFQAAAFYLAGKEPAKALPLLQELTGRPEPRKEWLRALVRAYMELDKYNYARLVLDRLLRMEPADPDLWRLSAGLSLRRKRYGDAAAELEIAFRLKPVKGDQWRMLASLYQAAGVPKKAAMYYRSAFDENETAEDLDLLANVYFQGNYFQEALAAARKAIRLKPTAERWDFIGRIHMIEKRYDESFSAFHQAAELDKKDGAYSLMAGYCALQLEQFDKAEASFKRVLARAKKGSRTAEDASKALSAVRVYRDTTK